MQHEQRRVERALTSAHSSPCPTVQRLSRAALQSGPISVMVRTLEPGVLKALDAVPAASLPQLRVIGHVGLISHSIDAALRTSGFAPPWLSDWLSDDIVFLARLFENLVGGGIWLARLEAVDDNACRRFHTDNVRFRLVTTYRGPGTEWLSPADASRLQDDQAVSDDRIRRVERGHVAVMRGAREATSDCPGLLHRSPRIEGSGLTRLFLAIDEAGDHEH